MRLRYAGRAHEYGRASEEQHRRGRRQLILPKSYLVLAGHKNRYKLIFASAKLAFLLKAPARHRPTRWDYGGLATAARQ